MELAVETRELLGKKVVSLRREGKIPAELYGHGVRNQHLTVDAKAFRKALKEAGERTVLTLVLGKQKFQTLIHDIQRDAISEAVTHVDFYEVRMDEKITTKVPFEFIGEPPAIKEFGGILNTSMTEVEVEALPADLPHHLTIDLTKLVAVNQSVHVKDIVVPKGVRIMVGPETVIATVTEKMKEEEVAPAPVVDVSEVKVEVEEQKQEREKEKAEKEKA